MILFERKNALPQSLRQHYLSSLPEPQEWFLEERVQSGEVWAAAEGAYGVFHGADLVEFHSSPDLDAAACLSALRQARPFASALCKSFDHPLWNAARALGATSKEVAYLFRRYTPTPLPGPEGFALRPARKEDLDGAVTLAGEFFASRSEAEAYLRAGGLWVASCQGDLIGCGITSPLHDPKGAVDLGMVTRADWRGRGVGSAIIAALAQRTMAEGKRPICGCAKGDLASKSALRKAGFRAEHRLLRLTFPV